MIGIIFLTFVCIALLIVFYSIHVRQMEMDLKYEQLYTLTLENVYQSLKAQVEEIHRYRHDLKDHIQVIEVLVAKKEQNSVLLEYLKEIKLKYKEVAEQKYCGNEILNALFALRKNECVEKGIELSIQVQDGDYNQINDNDFIKLIHNLLDNAIEACDRISAEDRKIIEFQLKNENGLCIYINNSYSKYEKMDFHTKKTNVNDHGYGMKILNSVIKKYKGKWDIQIDTKEYMIKQIIFIHT